MDTQNLAEAAQQMSIAATSHKSIFASVQGRFMPGNEQPVAIVMLFMHFFPVEQGFQRKNRRAFPRAGTPVNRNNRFHDKLMSFAPPAPQR